MPCYLLYLRYVRCTWVLIAAQRWYDMMWWTWYSLASPGWSTIACQLWLLPSYSVNNTLLMRVVQVLGFSGWFLFVVVVLFEAIHVHTPPSTFSCISFYTIRFSSTPDSSFYAIQRKTIKIISICTTNRSSSSCCRCFGQFVFHSISFPSYFVFSLFRTYSISLHVIQERTFHQPIRFILIVHTFSFVFLYTILAHDLPILFCWLGSLVFAVILTDNVRVCVCMCTCRAYTVLYTRYISR